MTQLRRRHPDELKPLIASIERVEQRLAQMPEGAVTAKQRQELELLRVCHLLELKAWYAGEGSRLERDIEQHAALLPADSRLRALYEPAPSIGSTRVRPRNDDPRGVGGSVRRD